MIELLVTAAIFMLITGVVYRTTWQYFRSYMKTDERMENLSEAWQALRIIKADLSFADFPSAGTSEWRNFVIPDTNSYTINRRRNDVLSTIKYEYDLDRGILSRSIDGKKGKPFLRERLRNFVIELTTRPDSKQLAVGDMPNAVFLHVRLELAKSKKKDAKALVLDTLVVPVFANLKLQKKYCSDLLPKALEGI